MKMSYTLQGCLFCQRMGSIFRPEVKKMSELGHEMVLSVVGVVVKFAVGGFHFLTLLT